MKRNIFILSLGLFACGCNFDSEFELPVVEDPVVEADPNSNIGAVINEYLQSGEEIYTFPGNTNAVIEAIVASSDEAGNFYKAIVLQDDMHGDDETRGILLMADLRAYFTRFEPGRKVFLRIAGLSIHGDKGVYRLGYRNMGELTSIPKPLLERFLVRSETRIDLKPFVSDASDLDESRLNTRIRISRVQFEKADLGKTFAGEPYDSYNALRPLRMCNGEAPIFLSTSVYADFKSELLPAEVFDVEGILSRDYDGQLVVIVNSPQDLLLSQEDRCDREYLVCDGSDQLATSKPDSVFSPEVIFYEDFEEIGSTREIEEAGWINLNMHFGTGKYVKRSQNENTFLRISSYGTQEAVVDVWLISPPIELDGWMEHELSFQTRATFNKGRLLTVWITTEPHIDPREAKWQELEARISEGTSDGSNERFLGSGPVSLECVQGTARIAFRYLGGDPGPSTNYDIDNILIRGRSQ